MHWHLANNGELILIDSTADERTRAACGIAGLRMAGKHGETTGGRLLQAIESGHLPWTVIKSLSSWCNSEGKYADGVAPAQAVSRAFFNEQVLPRLTQFQGDGVTEAIALQRFAKFAEKAGIWVDRTLVREQVARQSVPGAAERPTDQTRPTVTYKRGSVSDYSSLVHTYSNRDLASPFRSTVPLLAYWSEMEERLPNFAAALGLELSAPELFGFEYTVPVQEGKGNDSYTDLMLLLRSQSIAIEAKYTEPPYPVVRDWLGSSPSRNRVSVLTGWLNLINRATGAALEVANVLDCTYQLVHRVASACELGKQAQAMVYQCFDPTEKQLDYYYRQLSRLSRLIDRPEHLSFFLFAVNLQKSSEYLRLQDAWTVGNRDLSFEVRQGLVSRSLLDFGIPTVRRA
jgi:hypothetical protein